MIVWVVTRHYGDMDTVEGVFSDEQKSRAFIADQPKPKGGPVTWYTTAFVVDWRTNDSSRLG